MTKLYAVASDTFDVYYNQALEKYLLDQVKQDEVILYLWRNDRTVVIGKNQDAYSECKTDALTHDGGFLARRISGGGAVYHDQGNLNFTFLCRKDLFDIERQDQIILNAAINGNSIDISITLERRLTSVATKYIRDRANDANLRKKSECNLTLLYIIGLSSTI